MNSAISRRPFAIFAVALWFLPSSLPAAAIVWDAGGGDLAWSTGNNWNTNLVPTGADDVTFGSGLGATITLVTGELANSLLFSGSGYTLSSGDLTLTTGTITVDDGTAGVISATISSVLKGTTLTKAGADTLILAGANTFTGLTTVSAGVLNIQNATALGTVAGGTIVSNGAALELQGGITIGAEALTLTGDGVSSGGALRNISGTNSYNGNITLAGATRVNSDAGSLTIAPVGGNAFSGAFALTLGGAGNITVSKVIATGAGTLIKDGAGLLTLSAANTYTGLTTVSVGVLNIQNATALGTNASGTTVAIGAALQTQGTITVAGEALTLNGTGVGSTGALRNVLNNNSFNGNITLAGDTRINSDSGTLTLNPASGDAITGVFNLTLGGAGLITINKPITIGSGTLTKDGAGTVTLTGADTFTGATTIGAGVLNIQNGSALGTTAAGTSVTSGAALQVQSGIIVTDEALTLNGTGVGATGALRSISGNNSYNGTITLGSAVRINSDLGTLTLNPGTGDAITGTNQNLTLGGVGNISVAQGITIGSGTLTKDGAGTATLSGVDTYGGLTTVSVGVLNIQNNAALGSTAAGTTVTSGAALEMQSGVTVTGEALTLNGTGILSAGALRNISGNNNYSGNITLGAATRINSDAGLLTINPASGNAFAGAFGLTLGGAGNITVNNPIATAAGTLTKDGSGTLIVTGANTYTGTTTLSGGTLQLAYAANSSMLSNTAALILNAGTLDLAGTVAHVEIVGSTTLGGTTYITRSAGSSTLNLNTITVGASSAVDFSGNGIATTDNLNDASGILGAWATVNGSWATNSTNGADGAIVAYTGYTDIARLGSAVVGGTTNVRITDVGNTSGNVTLAAAGTTTINTLQQGASGGTATLDIGAGNTLRLATGGILLPTGNGALTLTNTGTLTAGLANNAAATLFLQNQNTSSLLTINSTIANNGTGVVALAKTDGTGTVILGGANTYAGATTVGVGVLNLQNSSALGTTAAGTSVTSGAALEMQGGITITGEALTLNGTGISNGGAFRNIADANSFNGNLTLGSATRINADAGSLTIDPTSGNAFAGAFNLTFGGAGNIFVNDPIATAAGTLIKDGTGTVTLSGANTYTGLTTVGAGVLNIQNATATGTTAGGVVVANGAALEMQGGITVGVELLTLNGTGISSGGALRNISGSNNYNTNITLVGDTRVNSDAGTLTIDPTSGNAFAGAYNLTLGGAGYITINDPIATVSGSVTKDGGGTVTLAGANTYIGNTTITAGVLNIRNATALGTVAAGTSVASGAVLEIQGVITETGEALTLAGTGISSGGALRNVSGANSFNGNITLTADTRVNSDAGTLTITPAAGNAFSGSFNLTLGGAGDITIGKPIATGAGTVTKDGVGRLTLGGIDTYAGLTSVNAGVLRAQTTTALGTSAAGTTVASGAALELTGTITITGESLTLNGAGIGGTGALRNVTNSDSFNGNIALAGDTRVNSDAGVLTINPASGDAITGPFNLTLGGVGAITISKPISIGSGTLSKDGTGTAILSGINTYTGATTVSAGVLNIQNATALGTSTAGTAVANGAALQLQNTITVTGESLTLNGSGVANTGALRNISTNTSFNANITLASDSRINSDANLLTINPATGDAITGSFNLTLGGLGSITIGKPISTGSGTLSKDGTGTVILSGVNTYTGLTTVSAGVLNIQNAAALGTIAAGATVSSGAALQMQGGITVTAETLTLNGTGVAATGALRSISGNNNFNGNVTLAGDARINSDLNTLTINPATGAAITGTFNLTLGGVGNITIGQAITTGSGTITKDGTGTAILSGANTYTGLTTVNVGVLNIQNASALGTAASGASVASGAALQVQGGVTVTGEALTLNGTGVAATGALRNVSGNNSLNGNITLGSAARMNSDAGTLTINPASGDAITGVFNLTLGGAGNMVIGQAITTGAGTITKDGAGTVTLSGANTYTGLTTVSVGVLNIQNNAGLGTNAAGTSVTSGAALQLQGGLTITGEGLTLNGTGISSGGALRNISGNNSFNGNITLGSATQVNSDAGTLTINPASGNAFAGAFNLTLGGAGNIVINQAIATGIGTLTKTGAGTATLTSANTYSGVTTVSAGALNIQNASALGTTAGGTSVSSGGALEIQGNISISGEAFTLNGTGVSNGGALRNVSGNNTYTGNITLGSATRVNSDSGTLTISPASGNAFAGAFALSFGGAGNITVNNSIATGAGTLTKDGAGILVMTGASTYTGATTLNGGTLQLAYGANSSMLSDSAALILNAGTLDLAGTVTHSEVVGSLTINGTAFITRSTGSSIINLNTITHNSGAALDLAADNIATTDNLNDVTGILGAWITVGGQFATNSTNAADGLITGYNGFLNIPRLGGSILGGATNTRITDSGNASGNITLSASGTTTINTLTQGASGGTATVDIGAGNTLRLATGGILLSSGNGALVFTNTGTLTAGPLDNTSATLFLENQDITNAVTINSVMADNGTGAVDLSKTNGSGRVILTGANTYTGLTRVSDGTLVYGASDVIASGGVTVDGATAVLDLAANHSDTVGTVILDNGGGVTGSGTSTLTSTGSFDVRSGFISAILGGAGITLTKTTVGTVTLSGANTFTGLTTISAGALVYGASNVIATGDVTVDGATAVLDLGANHSDTVGTVTLDNGGSITGSGTSTLTSTGSFELKNGSISTSLGGAGITLNKTTTGSVNLTGANTYTGATTVSAGTLILSRSAADNATIMTDGNTATTSDISVTGGSFVIGASEQIADSGSINISSGSFTYSGSGLVETVDKFSNSGGTFTTGANTLIGLGSTMTLSGGISTISDGGLVQDAHWVISGGTNTVNGGTTAGVLEVQAGGAGTGLYLTGTSSPTITLDSSNSVAGEILLKNDLYVDTGLTSGTAQILSGSSNANPGRIDLNGGTRIFDINNGSAATDLLISARIINGGLTKNNTGTLELTGNNAFTDLTTINAGTLIANGTGGKKALGGTTGITVNPGGTLLTASDQQFNAAAPPTVTLAGGTFNTAGTSQTLGALTLSSNSIIDLASGASVLQFADSSNQTWSGTLSIYNWSGTTAVGGGGGTDQIYFGTDNNGLSATQIADIVFYSDSGTTQWAGATVILATGEVVPIPEAGTWIGGLLAATGIAAVARQRRVRKR